MTKEQKQKARIEVNKALATGRLSKKPCEECGVLSVEAHHPNYAKPLNVVWLCKQHHSAEHSIHVRESSKYVGKEGVICIGKMCFDVKITDIKMAYGNTRFQVTPIAGEGSVWVEKVTLKKV